jgi:flagellar motor switch protein FliN/FliY
MASSFLSQSEIEKLMTRLNADVIEPTKKERDNAGHPTVEDPGLPPREVERVEFPELKRSIDGDKQREVGFFQEIPVTLSLELGGATLSVREILSLKKGSVVKLDKLAGENASLSVNGRRLAAGEVVVINDSFGCRVAELGVKSESAGEKEQGNG